MSDFDNFIRHSDFRRVLQLADMLRYQKAKLENLRGHEGLQPIYAPSSPSQTRKKKSAFGGSRSEVSQCREVGFRESNVYDNAAELLRVSLLPPSNSGSIAMERGECIITDSLIDETIESLADELRFYLDIKKQRIAHRGSQFSDPISNEGDTMNFAVDEKRNPVADKFSKMQTDLLTDWMIAHKEHPFPDNDEIHALAIAANLSPTQITNWTTNVRKRNLKATVVKEKKPHHFLDYLFLATDREKRMLEVHPEINMSMFNIAQAPNTINCLESHVRNMEPVQRLVPDYAPSESNHQAQQQPMNTRRHVASPKNSAQIFRRGKGQGHKKAELLAQLAEREGARESERCVLQDVAPRGMDDTPAGYFDKDDNKLGFDAVDVRIFEQIGNEFDSIPPVAISNGEQPFVVSFESLGDIPFDDCVDDYVLGLIAGV